MSASSRQLADLARLQRLVQESDRNRLAEAMARRDVEHKRVRETERSVSEAERGLAAAGRSEDFCLARTTIARGRLLGAETTREHAAEARKRAEIEEADTRREWQRSAQRSDIADRRAGDARRKETRKSERRSEANTLELRNAIQSTRDR